MSDSVKRQNGRATAKSAESGAKSEKKRANIDSPRPQKAPAPKKRRNNDTLDKVPSLVKAFLDVEHPKTRAQLGKLFKLDKGTVADILRDHEAERASRLDERIQRNIKAMADTITTDASSDYAAAITIYKETLERLKGERAHVQGLEETDNIKDMAARAKLLQSIEYQMFQVLWRIDGQKNINVKTLQPLGVSTGGGGATGDIGPQATIYNLYIKNVNVATPEALTQHEKDKKEIDADYSVEDKE